MSIKIPLWLAIVVCFGVALLAGAAWVQAWQPTALDALPHDAMLVRGDHELYYSVQHAPVVDSLIADYECDCWRMASTRERMIIVWQNFMWFDVMSEPYTRDRFVVTAQLSDNRLAVFVSGPRPSERVYGDWHGVSAVVVDMSGVGG